MSDLESYAQTAALAAAAASWSAALLALVVLAISRIGGRWISPSWRSAMWMLVLLRLSMPVAPAAVTSLQNLMPRLGFETTTDSERQAGNAAVIGGSEFGKSVGLGHDPARVAESIAAVEPGRAVANSPPAILRALNNFVISHWAKVFTFVWMAGMLAVACRWAYCAWQLRTIVRRSECVRDEGVLRLAEACAQQAGLRNCPAIKRAPPGAGPAVAGLWRPVLFLPVAFLPDRGGGQFDGASLRLVLLHEMRHIRAGDCWLAWWMRLMCAIHWFNPLAWFAARECQAERELACDAWVLRSANAETRSRYGQALLSALEGAAPSAAIRWTTGMALFPGLTERRIRSMKTTFPTSRNRTALMLLLAAAIAAVGLTGPIGDRASAGSRLPDAAGAGEQQAKDDKEETDENANKAVAADAPTQAKNNEDNEAQPKNRNEEKANHATVIIAQHVILLNGKIVTWDGLRDGLRKLLDGGASPPKFHFTNGAVIVDGKMDKFNELHERVDKLAKELKITGHWFSFTSPPASKRYDAVRTAADLKVDPARRKTGVIHGAEGRPVEGATVLVRTIDEPHCTIYLAGTQLRDRVDESWTTTKADGRFEVFPASDDFVVAVLHQEGFAIVGPQQVADGDPIVLQPWAVVELTVRQGGEVKQSPGVAVSAKPAGAAFSISFQAFPRAKPDTPVRVAVPAGGVDLHRTIEVDGRNVYSPADRFSIKAGETRSAELPPPTAEDVEKAREKLAKTGL